MFGAVVSPLCSLPTHTHTQPDSARKSCLGLVSPVLVSTFLTHVSCRRNVRLLL